MVSFLHYTIYQPFLFENVHGIFFFFSIRKEEEKTFLKEFESLGFCLFFYGQSVSYKSVKCFCFFFLNKKKKCLQKMKSEFHVSRVVFLCTHIHSLFHLSSITQPVGLMYLNPPDDTTSNPSKPVIQALRYSNQ